MTEQLENLRGKIDEYVSEHQEMYEKLNSHLAALVKVKNEANNPYLVEQLSLLLNYSQEILNSHFADEEKNLFPYLPVDEVQRLLQDHHEIKEKTETLEAKLAVYKKMSLAELNSQDCKELLFAGYNLIGTISHHAQREDRLFKY